MSETLAAVKGLDVIVERFSPHRLTLPDEPSSARMLRLLGAAEISPAPPPTDFLENVRRNLVAGSSSGKFSPRDLRLLWNGNPPAATLAGLLSKLLDQASTSGKTLRRLIEVYLRDFDPHAPGINEAAAKIRRELEKGGPLLDTWCVAQEEVKLFDPTRGPTSLAACLLEPGEQIQEILTRYKLDRPLLAEGKYMLAVEDAVRARVAEMLREAAKMGLDRVLQILAPGGRLRFTARVAHTGRALLRAWLDGGPEPNPGLRPPVQQCLLQWFGDPRMRLQAWAAVGEKEAALMRAWLARASLELFFTLIKDYALDSQWQYREAFWLACLANGAIADAWLALGGQTFKAARTVRELGGAFGLLRGGDANQSALLLRIGPLVMCEFTHNGSLRAWPADWPNAPRLGERSYVIERLKQSCLAFPPDPLSGKGGSADGTGLRHDGASSGRWQRSAAALIERRAGIRTARYECSPR